MALHQLDEEALRRLVGRCAVLVGSAAAEDLAQDTLVAALRSDRAPANREDLDAWLVGVARNMARRHWKARAREVSLASGPIEVAAPAGVPDDDSVERRQHLAQSALRRLPAASRSLLADRVLAGRRTDAIAEERGLSPAAASMRLTRARDALRRVITDELAHEARSAGIRVGHPGWRPTPLWCTDCGDRRLESRRTDDHVAFRCPACASHPQAVGSAFRLANPTFAALLGGVVQPAAVARRAAAWSHAYFTPGGGAAQAPCTACGQLAPLAAYRRTDARLALRHRVGLQVSCPACGETVSSSLGGMAASLPESRELRARVGRVRATEAMTTQVDGRSALVVGQRAAQGSAGVEMVVAADTLRLIHVRTIR